jgi:hypothetical protein
MESTNITAVKEQQQQQQFDLEIRNKVTAELEELNNRQQQQQYQYQQQQSSNSNGSKSKSKFIKFSDGQETLTSKPFWIWDKEQHKQEDIDTKGNCCFNHIIGLPQKDGDDKPLCDYQQIIFDSLVSQNNKASMDKESNRTWYI